MTEKSSMTATPKSRGTSKLTSLIAKQSIVKNKVEADADEESSMQNISMPQ